LLKLKNLSPSIILSQIILFFFFFFVFFSGGIDKIWGEEINFPTFGDGQVKVRLYTDYFCPPCRDMEPGIEPMLIDLVKNGAIQLVFVDVPTSRHTALYATYFLFSLGANKDIDSAIKARRVLFEAAEKKLAEGGQLIALFKEKGIEFKALDPYPVFNLWNQYMQEDQIRSTPTCVIIDGQKKETYRGNLDVPKALEKLKAKLILNQKGKSSKESR
ncbi:MAG: DsbA family protein, partial [Thermodesulfobacteriota bacterium]